MTQFDSSNPPASTGLTPSRRRFLLGAATSGLALAVAGGRGDPAWAQEKKLTFWSQLAGSKKAAGEALEAAFKTAHPEVALNSSLYGDPAQLNEKILTAINGNSAPDLFVQHWDFTLTYGSGDKLLDMKQALPDVNFADLDAGLLAYCHTSGPTVSVPLYGTSRGLGFNRKLVAAAGLDPNSPPKDWEDLRKWAKLLTKRGPGGRLEVSGFNLFYNDTQIWELFTLFLQGAGGSILTPDNKAPAFGGPEGLRALTFMCELVNLDKVTDQGFGMGNGVANPFEQSRAGMIIAGNFSTNNALKAGIDFAVAPFPNEKAGGFTSLVDPFCFAIPASTKNKEAAATFVKFALSSEQQVAFCAASKNVPALKSAQQNADVQKDIYLSKFVEFAGYAPKSVASIPAYSRMSTIVARYVQEAMYEQIDAKTALKSATAEVQAILARG